ncbi:MAG TPA: hypothetical protein VJ783_25225, partial [Pirellulales bacterium]|nr:hypothetical protein [Pirellulales bacterium]
MARRRASRSNNSTETSKADLIRGVAREATGRVRPRDIIATLAERGVKVSSAQVSTVLRKMGLRRRRRRKGAAAEAGSGVGSRVASRGVAMLQLDHLLAAKRLCDKLGGVEAAK